MTVNWRRGTELAPRRLWDRARSVLGGIPTQSVGTIIKSAPTLIVPDALRGHASRDALRHKWHRLRIQ